MKPTKFDLLSNETLKLLYKVAMEADGPYAAIVRHSARNYLGEPEMEPFLTLTDEGKGFACEFGTALSRTMKPVLTSSYITRCVETADLICKGFAMEKAVFPAHTVVDKMAAPFYMNDIPAAVRRHRELGHDIYLRMWMNGELPESEIMSSKQTAERICEWLISSIDNLKDGEIGLAITHDWNLFPVKEHVLNQRHEEFGQIGYLEGVVLFRKEGRFMVQGVVGDPVEIE